MEGAISVWQSEWLPRYLRSDAVKLSVYDDAGSAVPRWKMALSVLEVTADASSTKRFTCDDGHATTFFRASTSAERDAWVAHFAAVATGWQKAAIEKTSSPEGMAMKPVGRYMLGEQIGAGGFAHVLTGYDSESMERVAAKVMRATALSDKMIRNEIEMMGRLRHRNIVELKDVVWHDGDV